MRPIGRRAVRDQFPYEFKQVTRRAREAARKVAIHHVNDRLGMQSSAIRLQEKLQFVDVIARTDCSAHRLGERQAPACELSHL